MGRKPSGVARHNMNFNSEELVRVRAIVGEKGMSKFVRDAIREKLDQVIPGEEEAGPPYFEQNGGHEPGLSASGRATIFAILRRKNASLDQMQAAFGFADPVDFIHALLGHRSLPNQAAGAMLAELLDKFWTPPR